MLSEVVIQMHLVANTPLSLQYALLTITQYSLFTITVSSCTLRNDTTTCMDFYIKIY